MRSGPFVFVAQEVFPLPPVALVWGAVDDALLYMQRRTFGTPGALAAFLKATSTLREAALRSGRHQLRHRRGLRRGRHRRRAPTTHTAKVTEDAPPAQLHVYAADRQED